MTESLDAAQDGAIAVASCAPGARHPECGSHPDNPVEFKCATTHGGARAGAGRPRKPPSVAVLAPGYAGLRWYCVEVHARREVEVAEALLHLGFDALAPQYLDELPANPARKLPRREVLRPALPGYVIAEFDQTLPEWRRIASQRGVRRVMGSSPERPSPLQVGVAAWLIGQFGFGGVQRQAKILARAEPLEIGAVVEVVGGLGLGWRGRVVSSDGRSVVVEVEGRRVRLAQAAVVACTERMPRA